MKTYTLHHADGSASRYGITEQAALSQVAGKYGVLVSDLVTHDDGARILIWTDEASAEKDDGRKAVAELV